MRPIRIVRRQGPLALLGVLGLALPLYGAHASEPSAAPADSSPQGAASADSNQQSTATADSTQPGQPAVPQTLHEVVVTGLRASLVASMKLKEDATQVLDAISAQDIGQFPDSDVAESLSRLPGVAIDRDGTGAGSEATIRGFGPAFNVVTVNGQELPTQGSTATGSARQFNFDALPSDAITSAVVYKTSEAWQADGAIGGLVELHTAEPFDFDGPKAIAKLGGSYASQDTDVEPEGFLLLSNTFDDDKFGALFSVGEQEQATRAYQIDSDGWWAMPVNSAGNPTATYVGGKSGTPSSVLMPDTVDIQNNEYNVKRLNMNVSLQWHVTSDITATLDGLYNKFTQTNLDQDLGLYVDGNPISNGVTVRPDGVVQNFTVASHADLIEDTQADQISPQFLRSLHFKLHGRSFGGQLVWNLDASDAQNSASDYTDPSLFTVAGFPIPVTYTSNGGKGIPTLSTPDDLINTSLPLAHYIDVSAYNNQNDIRQATTDETWINPDSWKPLTDIRFGAYWQRNSYYSFNSYNEGDVCAYCGYKASVPGDLFYPTGLSGGFVSPYGGSFPTSWLGYNPSQYLTFLQSSTAFNEQDAAAGYPPGTTQATVQGSGGYTPWSPGQPGALQSLATVVEKTTAAYVQGDFNGDDLFGFSWGGNLGVRFVHTQDAAVGYGQILTDITAIPNDPTGDNAIYANNGATIRQGASSSYNYALPSLNFRLNLPRDLVLRAAASKSLARPEPSQLTPVVNYGGGILAPTDLAATGGNPNLRPYTSVNYDLGLEWYYQPGGYLAIDGFDKKLTNFIEYVESPLSVPIVNSEHLAQFSNNVATFNLTAPTNIGSANVHGVELSAQHMFSYLPSPFDGFGINANATIMSTNAGINSGSGSGSSTQTFGLTGLGDYQNLTLIYQKYGLGVRLAYSHRNTYIYQIGDPYNDLAPIYIKGYGELDGQISYQVNEHVIVALSGTNLTKSVLQEYDTRPDEFLSLLNYGARYELSVRAAF